MSFINIRDYKTGKVVKALNFGGPKLYTVEGRQVWAPKNGTSFTITDTTIKLLPLNLTINHTNIWVIISHQNIGTINWRVTVKNLATNEVKLGVYPFNWHGNVYELECQPGTWVIASCGGYKIESSWVGKNSNEAYRLRGTGEIIKIIAPNYTYVTNQVGGSYSRPIGGTSPFYLQNERNVQTTLPLNDCSISSEIIQLKINVVAFGDDVDYWSAYNQCKGAHEEIYMDSHMYYEIVEYPEELVKFLINKDNKYAKLINGYFDIPTPSPVISFTPATYHVGAAWWETTSTPALLTITLGKRVRLINYQSFPFADRAFIESLPGVLN